MIVFQFTAFSFCLVLLNIRELLAVDKYERELGNVYINMKNPCEVFVTQIMLDEQGRHESSLDCQMSSEDGGGSFILGNPPAGLDENKVLASSDTFTFFSEKMLISQDVLYVPEGAVVKVEQIPPRLTETTLSSKNKTVDERSILVVRVVALDGKTTATEAELSDRIFGTHGDPHTVTSQFSACSNGQQVFVPAPDREDNIITDGVVTATFPFNITGLSGRGAKNLASAELERMGIKSTDYRHFMYCVPQGVKSFIAFSSGSPDAGEFSVYYDYKCKHSVTGMHELGHYLGLGHSGSSASPYGDTSCSMGYDSKYDTKKCYNGHKLWQLGWYSDRHATADLAVSSWEGSLIGIVDYPQASEGQHVVLEIPGPTIGMSKSFFVSFYRAKSFMSDLSDIVYIHNCQADNCRHSYIEAYLFSGQSHALKLEPAAVIVEVSSIDLSTPVATAQIKVFVQHKPSSSPTQSVMPSTSPTSSSPTRSFEPSKNPSDSRSARPSLLPSKSNIPSLIPSQDPTDAIAPSHLPSVSAVSPRGYVFVPHINNVLTVADTVPILAKMYEDPHAIRVLLDDAELAPSFGPGVGLKTRVKVQKTWAGLAQQKTNAGLFLWPPGSRRTIDIVPYLHDRSAMLSLAAEGIPKYGGAQSLVLHPETTNQYREVHPDLPPEFVSEGVRLWANHVGKGNGGVDDRVLLVMPHIEDAGLVFGIANSLGPTITVVPVGIALDRLPADTKKLAEGKDETGLLIRSVTEAACLYSQEVGSVFEAASLYGDAWPFGTLDLLTVITIMTVAHAVVEEGKSMEISAWSKHLNVQMIEEGTASSFGSSKGRTFRFETWGDKFEADLATEISNILPLGMMNAEYLGKTPLRNNRPKWKCSSANPCDMMVTRITNTGGYPRIDRYIPNNNDARIYKMWFPFEYPQDSQAYGEWTVKRMDSNLDGSTYIAIKEILLIKRKHPNNNFNYFPLRWFIGEEISQVPYVPEVSGAKVFREAGGHLSYAYLQGLASGILTLVTGGRSFVGEEPEGGPSNEEWQKWHARKTAYVLAWNMARPMHPRPPFLEVAPTSRLDANALAQGHSGKGLGSATVQFLEAPQSPVTITIKVKDTSQADAVVIIPESITITPENYARRVHVYVVTSGNAPSGTEVAVTFLASSADSAVNGVSDTWTFMTHDGTLSPTEASGTPTVFSSTKQSEVPSAVPSGAPNINRHPPTVSKSLHPSMTLSTSPSASSSIASSTSPSVLPSITLSALPSVVSSNDPSLSPSIVPSKDPSLSLSDVPSYISALPSVLPSKDISLSPSTVPSKDPSLSLSDVPSYIPTKETVAPTTIAPTALKDPCVNQWKKSCPEKCVFGKKKIRGCLPKLDKHKHNCSQYTERKPCRDVDACKFVNEKCFHKCDGLAKSKCKKEKFCKPIKVPNPCAGCQLVTCGLRS